MKILLVLLLLLLFMFLIIHHRTKSTTEKFTDNKVINDIVSANKFYEITDTTPLSSTNIDKAEDLLTKKKVLEEDINEATELLKINFDNAKLHELLQRKGFLKDVDFSNIDFSGMDFSNIDLDDNSLFREKDFAEIELLKKKLYFRDEFLSDKKINDIDFSKIDIDELDFTEIDLNEGKGRLTNNDLHKINSLRKNGKTEKELDLIKKKMYIKNKLINHFFPSNYLDNMDLTNDSLFTEKDLMAINALKKQLYLNRIYLGKLDLSDVELNTIDFSNDNLFTPEDLKAIKSLKKRLHLKNEYLDEVNLATISKNNLNRKIRNNSLLNLTKEDTNSITLLKKQLYLKNKLVDYLNTNKLFVNEINKDTFENDLFSPADLHEITLLKKKLYIKNQYLKHPYLSLINLNNVELNNGTVLTRKEVSIAIKSLKDDLNKIDFADTDNTLFTEGSDDLIAIKSLKRRLYLNQLYYNKIISDNSGDLSNNVNEEELTEDELNEIENLRKKLILKKIYYDNLDFLESVNININLINFNTLNIKHLDFTGKDKELSVYEDDDEIILLKKKLYFKRTRENNKINNLKQLNKNILAEKIITEKEKQKVEEWKLKNYKIEANKIKRKVLEDRLIKSKIESQNKNEYAYIKEKLERIDKFDPYKDDTIHNVCPLGPIEYNINQFQKHNLEITKHPSRWDGLYHFTRKNTFPTNYIIL